MSVRSASTITPVIKVVNEGADKILYIENNAVGQISNDREYISLFLEYTPNQSLNIANTLNNNSVSTSIKSFNKFVLFLHL